MHKYSAFFAVPEAMFVRFVNAAAGREKGNGKFPSPGHQPFANGSSLCYTDRKCAKARRSAPLRASGWQAPVICITKGI